MTEKRMWREAENHLRERGWTSVLSACVSGPTREYGTLFCRDGLLAEHRDSEQPPRLTLASLGNRKVPWAVTRNAVPWSVRDTGLHTAANAL